jgi:hypothetical protein
VGNTIGLMLGISMAPAMGSTLSNRCERRNEFLLVRGADGGVGRMEYIF